MMKSHSKPVQRSLSANEVNFDIANTHQSNQELRQCETVKRFFAQAATVGSLKDDNTREWTGSLPNIMFNSAIPLFTDDSGNDFQLHFSFTWMYALHTAGTRDANCVDPYVHRLLHVVESDNLKVIEHPEIVVPIGKLFVNRDGHSIWTGYEVFVSVDMGLWIVYNLDEFDPHESYPEEVRLSKWNLPGCKEEGLDDIGEPPTMRISCLWDSLKTIDSATFLKAESYVRQFSIRDYVGTFYLLELLRTEASRAISFSDRLVHTNFATEKFTVDAASDAGHELLMLAYKNAKTPIMKLTFDESAQYIEDHSQSLLSLAILHEDESLVDFIFPFKEAIRFATSEASEAIRDTLLPLGVRTFLYDDQEQLMWAGKEVRRFAFLQAANHAIKYTAKFAVWPNLLRAVSSQMSAAVFFAVFLVYWKAGLELGKELGRETAGHAGTLTAAAIEKLGSYDVALQLFLEGKMAESDIYIPPQSSWIHPVAEFIVDAITAATRLLDRTEILTGETQPQDPLVWVSDGDTRTRTLNDIAKLVDLYAVSYTKAEFWKYRSSTQVKQLKRYQDTSFVATSTAKESRSGDSVIASRKKQNDGAGDQTSQNPQGQSVPPHLSTPPPDSQLICAGIAGYPVVKSLPSPVEH